MKKTTVFNTLLVGVCCLSVITEAQTLAYREHSQDGKSTTFLVVTPRNPAAPNRHTLEYRTVDPDSEWVEIPMNVVMGYTSDAFDIRCNLDTEGDYNEYRVVKYAGDYSNYPDVTWTRVAESPISKVVVPSEDIEYLKPVLQDNEIIYDYRVRGSVNIQLSRRRWRRANWQTVTTVSEAPIEDKVGYAQITCKPLQHRRQFARLEVITDSGTYYTSATKLVK